MIAGPDIDRNRFDCVVVTGSEGVPAVPGLNAFTDSELAFAGFVCECFAEDGDVGEVVEALVVCEDAAVARHRFESGDVAVREEFSENECVDAEARSDVPEDIVGLCAFDEGVQHMHLVGDVRDAFSDAIVRCYERDGFSEERLVDYVA